MSYNPLTHSSSTTPPGPALGTLAASTATSPPLHPTSQGGESKPDDPSSAPPGEGTPCNLSWGPPCSCGFSNMVVPPISPSDSFSVASMPAAIIPCCGLGPGIPSSVSPKSSPSSPSDPPIPLSSCLLLFLAPTSSSTESPEGGVFVSNVGEPPPLDRASVSPCWRFRAGAAAGSCRVSSDAPPCCAFLLAAEAPPPPPLACCCCSCCCCCCCCCCCFCRFF
mmetsp:Transcript_15356/g.38595  ORF Transcript_15356/g.38595 Transcript_15356/m.38595 type:complete len:222 (+) Transcript_15356:463-1128(+)